MVDKSRKTHGRNGTERIVHNKITLWLNEIANPTFYNYIIMLIIVNCLLMEMFFFSLKPTVRILIFQRKFVPETYLLDLVLLSLETYF